MRKTIFYIYAANIDITFKHTKKVITLRIRIAFYCALLSFISHCKILAHPAISFTGTNSPPHRLAVAGVLDELRGMATVAAADGKGGVTGGLNWLLFLHLRPVVWL